MTPALAEIRTAIIDAGFTVLDLEEKFPWNDDCTVLKTADGFYGGVKVNHPRGYLWSVTSPADVRKSGTAVSPVAARAAVQFWISELRRIAR